MKRLSIAIALLLASWQAEATQIYSGSLCADQGGWDTWANLATDYPASSHTCATAWTADKGSVWSDGTTWISDRDSSVLSVALTAPSVFTVTGSPVGPGTGTLALSFATGQTANRFLATPSGTTGAVALRAIASADLPATISSNTSGNAATATTASSATTAGSASTATALATTPTQCSGGNFSTGIAASGNANCSAPPSFGGVGTPNSRSLSLATAFQATNNAKPAQVSINLTSTANLSLSGGTTNAATVVIGSTSAVASGTGTVIANYANSNTGALTIGLNLSTISAVPVSFSLPAGWFFAVLQTSGTVSITSAFDQSLG